MIASQRPSSVGRMGDPGYSPRGTGTPGRQSSGIGSLPLPAAGAAVLTASARGCGAGREPAADAAVADTLLEGTCPVMAGACRNAGIAAAACALCGLDGRAPRRYMAIRGPGPAPAPVEPRPLRAPCIWPSKELCGERWSELAEPAEDARGLCTAALSTDTRLLAESPAGSAALVAFWVAFGSLRGAGWTSA